MSNIDIKDNSGVVRSIETKLEGSIHTIYHRVKNVSTLRDSCEGPFTEGDIWNLSKATNDLLLVDGNALACSYYDLSLDPFSANTETTLTSVDSFAVPFEVSVGLSLSLRTVGQEFSVELVDATNNIEASDDLTISAIQQATTTLTITTTTAHGFSVGRAFGVFGCADSRLNYPALVVSAVTSPTQFLATAGPAGNIPSVTAGPFASGTVYSRRRLGLAANGTSMIFENTTATQASFYVRSDAGDALPSATFAGNHSATVATTASAQAVNSPYMYAFQPTSEYRLTLQPERVQWHDSAIDGVTQTAQRMLRTQVVPDPAALYKLRFRATNNKGKTIPVGKITAAAKTGTTTATVTTDVPHGLTTSDLIAIYGARDTTNFPNVTTATAVTAVIDANNFQVVWGGAVTASTQSGIVYRVNGGILPSAQGALTQVVQSVVRTSNILFLTGSASWSGFSVGDDVNLAGCYDTAGVSMGLDGTYRVRTAVTTVMELEPIGTAPTGTDITATNCGGAVVKRTCMRISFVRIADFELLRSEPTARPITDLMNVSQVNVANTPAATISSGTITTVSTVTAVTTAGTPPVPATAYFLNSAASTNGALILTGTSGLQAFYASNNGATVAHVKLYNKATAPTVGTDIPEAIIPVPPAVGTTIGFATLPAGYQGLRFPLGLGIAITGLMADSDTTAVAASQVKVKISRTV